MQQFPCTTTHICMVKRLEKTSGNTSGEYLYHCHPISSLSLCENIPPWLEKRLPLRDLNGQKEGRGGVAGGVISSTTIKKNCILWYKCVKKSNERFYIYSFFVTQCFATWNNALFVGKEWYQFPPTALWGSCFCHRSTHRGGKGEVKTPISV